jgi:starch synthase
MRVLFASSEIFPYAKSGGLSDISMAFMKALQGDVELFGVMPLYGFVEKRGMKKETSFEITLGASSYDVEIFSKTKGSLLYYFVDSPLISSRENMYGDADGDYEDNALRFALFSAAIVELAKELKVDILHLNDWHTALAPLFLKEQESGIKTVFTIHNLAYQGIFEPESLARIGIDEKKYFHPECLEFYKRVNFLKAGIALGDAITTVSPSYAKEIRSEQYGFGLEGFLEHHQDKLVGILNGIDTQEFNPAKDKALTTKYDSDNLEAKYQNKKEFLRQHGLKDPRKPLFVMVSRLVEQKGVELLLETLHQLLEMRMNLFILGEGVLEYEKRFEAMAQEYENFTFQRAYDEKLSRQVYAAADFLLMPSLFEPCGLNQFIAMRYGAVPLVHNVGGLHDSVSEDQSLGCGSGFVFDNFCAEEFLACVERAFAAKKQSKKFKEMVQKNMDCDFSFASSAKEYLRLYESLL